MGVMLDLDDVIQPFRTLAWTMPYRFAFGNMSYIEYAWNPWPVSGAERCPVGDTNPNCIYHRVGRLRKT